MQKEDEEKEIDLGSDEHEAPLPLTVTSRVSFLITLFLYFLPCVIVNCGGKCRCCTC